MTTFKMTTGVALLSMVFAAPVMAEPLIPLDQCWVQPNTGKYVTKHGQIDCYTGEFASVEGNAGNNIGTSPQDRKVKAKPTKQERDHKRSWRQFVQNKRSAVQAALNAKRALRDRDWSAARSYTRQAVAYGKAAAAAYQTWQATAP